MHRQIWRAAVPLLLPGGSVRGAVALPPVHDRRGHLPRFSKADVAGSRLFAGALRRQKRLFLLPHVGTDSGGAGFFPYPAALAVNLTGTAVAQTLPFLLGRRNRHGPRHFSRGSPKWNGFSQESRTMRGCWSFAAAGGGVSGGSGQSGAGSGGDSTLPVICRRDCWARHPGSGSHAAGRRPLGPVEPAVLGFGGDQRRHYRFVSHHLASVQLPALRSAALKKTSPGRRCRSGLVDAAFPSGTVSVYPTSKNCQEASVPGPVMDTRDEEDRRNADGSVISRIVRAV